MSLPAPHCNLRRGRCQGSRPRGARSPQSRRTPCPGRSGPPRDRGGSQAPRRVFRRVRLHVRLCLQQRIGPLRRSSHILRRRLLLLRLLLQAHLRPQPLDGGQHILPPLRLVDELGGEPLVLLPQVQAQQIHQGLAVGEEHQAPHILRVLPVGDLNGDGAVVLPGVVPEEHAMEQIGPQGGFLPDLRHGAVDLVVGAGAGGVADYPLLRPLLHQHQQGVDQVLIGPGPEGVPRAGVPVAVDVELGEGVGPLQHGRAAAQAEAQTQSQRQRAPILPAQ